jgi:hypothetical protein
VGAKYLGGATDDGKAGVAEAIAVEDELLQLGLDQ